MFRKNNKKEKGKIQNLCLKFLINCSFLTFCIIHFYILFPFYALAEIAQNPYIEADRLAKEEEN